MDTLLPRLARHLGFIGEKHGERMVMGIDIGRVRAVIADFLERAEKTPNELTDETQLFGSGLELDSLEAAELSAMLEDELGTDPFSEGDLPEMIGDLVRYYEARAGT